MKFQRLYNGVHIIDAPSNDNVRRLDMGIVPMVDRMQEIGIRIDKEHFYTFGKYLGQECERLSDLGYSLTGKRINMGSPDPIEALLFGRGNLGLPIPFARVQYRETREEVRTNIRLHMYPADYGTYWDGFNIPVWAMEKSGFLFVRTYSPRTDQSYVDVIQDGTLQMVRERFPVIDVGPVADKIKL